MTDDQFHITYTPPNKAMINWPDGIWALYQITGDQIAERIVYKEIAHGENVGPHYRGGIIARHSWCGYVGSFGSLVELTAAVAKATGTT